MGIGLTNKRVLITGATGLVGNAIKMPDAIRVGSADYDNGPIRKLYPDFTFTPIEEGLEKAISWFVESVKK